MINLHCIFEDDALGWINYLMGFEAHMYVLVLFFSGVRSKQLLKSLLNQ
jgi:hypothetical protein